MVQIQKQLSRKVGDKEYIKYVLVIPPKNVKEAGFKEGQELKLETRNGHIIISKNFKINQNSSN